MKEINVNDYDLVVTLKGGCVELYKYGIEQNGIQGLKFEVEIDELPSLMTKEIICDKNGNYYKAGTWEKENIYGKEGNNENIIKEEL